MAFRDQVGLGLIKPGGPLLGWGISSYAQLCMGPSMGLWHLSSPTTITSLLYAPSLLPPWLAPQI